MSSSLVADFDDPKLDDYRNVPDARLLAERHRFIAEGRLVVRRLLESGRFPVRSVMVTRAACDALSDVFDSHGHVPVYEVTQETMNRVTGINLHRGCLAVGERTPGLDPLTLVSSGKQLIAVEGVANADNVGSIFRNAWAFGIDGVLLDAMSVDPLYRKALRTSMGAAVTIPFARADDWHATLRTCHHSGMHLIALTPDPSAHPIAGVAASLRHEPTVLIVGSEGEGLSNATLAECDVRARIPMHPGVDSLNVATAAAIALYELCGRQ